MKKLLILLLVVTFTSCAQKTAFDDVALNETFTNLQGKQIPFKNILEKHKGKTIFIEIWASWCSDCVGDLPKVKLLEKEETEVVYIKLSLDKTFESWKAGLKRFNVDGENYFINKGWKPSEFCGSIGLNWIPRYMIVGKDGTIKMYKATKITDKTIRKTIKADK
jgi:thiol-disulfide isomerase/thioredoxin